MSASAYYERRTGRRSARAIEALVDKTVRLGERAGASRPGRKVLTLIHAIAAGADSIDDTDVLRSGAGAGPGTGRLTIDIDSFLGEAKGQKKQGASRGYTGVRGYHPLLARVRRAGAEGEILIRAENRVVARTRAIDHRVRGAFLTTYLFLPAPCQAMPRPR